MKGAAIVESVPARPDATDGWPRALGEDMAQAAVEMALSLPLFLLVIFGMFQCSVVLQRYCNASYACRSAARYASLHSTTSLAPSTSTQIQAMVQSGLFLNSSITPTISVNYFNASNLSSSSTNLCAGTPDSSLNVVGNVVCVQASWTQSLGIPFMTSKSNSIFISTQAYKIISR